MASFVLLQIRTYLSVQHRLMYYNAYIQSHTELCYVVWGNSCNFNPRKIEKLQRRASTLNPGNGYTTQDAARNYCVFKQLKKLSLCTKQH